MLQWFKNHPEFLRKESTALSNDSNYKELFQWRDNLFISHGNIIVRANGTHRYPVLIIYSNATPYRLPLMFPLQRELSVQGIKELASLDFYEAIKRIKPVIKFYYHLRHQNSSGELCTLEREDLDGSNKFYGISSVLGRVRDWHAGHVTGIYPPDSEEVNFEAHFNFINQDTKLFYSDEFTENSLEEGDCYALLFKFIPKGTYFTEDRCIYLGCFMDGVSQNKIITQQPVDITRFMLHEKIKTSFDLYTETSIVEQLIEEKQLLKAHWFHIIKEPEPFGSLKDLMTILGNGNYEFGLRRFSLQSIDAFKQVPDFFYLGLRWANRKGHNEFQLFKIWKKSPPVAFMGINENDPVKKIVAILDCYEKIEAVESEKLTADSFHQRNSTRADYNILKYVFVNILGVGAIGGELADCLAKAGCGSIALFDNQVMKAHNAVRHIAGIDYLGFPKVSAVIQILNNHNPFIKSYPMIGDLYNLDASTHIADNSISLCSVADDNVEGYINQQLVIANKPAFYVRALRGGKAARIFRVIPGQDACFHCLSLYRNDRKQFIEIPDDPLYPTLKNECNNPIRPASAADLKFIASMASGIFIEHLQSGPSEMNHWIYTTEIISGTLLNVPNHLYSQHLPPHPNCAYCHHENKVSVSINNDCISFMQTLVAKNPTIETGGVMAGYADDKGNIIITHVSGPGPGAVMSATKFEKDIVFCQKFLDDLYCDSGQKTIYVGEWHSHPSANNHPSGTDIKSLSEIAVEKNYLVNCPAMIIFSNTGKPSCTLHPAGKLYYHTDLIVKSNT